MLGEIITGCKAVLDHISTHRNVKREIFDHALASLYIACTETKIYIQRFQRTGISNHQTEEELARLWSKASVPLRHIDPDLARRCIDKSEYWLNPENWSDDDIARYRIGIGQVANEARKLAMKRV